ncbi:MAG: triose-phosphate isomerase [Chloroflexota bacterium]
MKKFMIAGNWKMNMTPPEAMGLARDLRNSLTNQTTDVAVCPPFISIPAVLTELSGSGIKVGAQNCFWETKGAFTGEVSAEMIKAAGAEYVIIGHSERRAYFSETDLTVNNKIKSALAAGLRVIFCIGETLDERRAGATFEVIERQLKVGLDSIESMEQITIAYEPVWAIGTGVSATTEQAQEAHYFIRKFILSLYPGSALRILYGGSMNAGNASELLSLPDVDGGLIGGASLAAESFLTIIQKAETITNATK